MKYSYKDLLSETKELKTLLNEFRSNFQWKDFNKLKDIKEKIDYAKIHLKYVGEGSSRVAFLMPNMKQILKVARNNKGIGQNREEVNVYTNPASKPIVTKVYNAANDYSWILSEIARPLTSASEFEQKVGFPFAYIELVFDLPSNDPRVATYSEKIPFIKHVIETAKASHILPGDLKFVDHYGVTTDGRVVLLDYGFTHEVWKKHYANKSLGSPERETTKWFDAQKSRDIVPVQNIASAETEKAASSPDVTRPVRKRNV